jgi:hypothetical protein
MTISVFESVTENKTGGSNGYETSNRTVTKCITISDDEIIALLTKLLVTKKELILNLLKEK